MRIIILWALMSGLCFAQDDSHSFIPRDGRLIIIGQERDAIDGYIANIGIVPAGFMAYTSIQNIDGLDEPSDHGSGVNNAQYYVNSYPHSAIQLGLYLVGALDGILEGRYDGNIVKMAQWMKNTGCPIYLRIGYEFDLPGNGYDPRKYQQAYRYIVDRLRDQDVDNVAYVWHSAALIESKGNFMDWYPGDDYVDWFAVSIFNPMQIAVADKFFAVGRAHDKSLMIAESAPIGLFSTNTKKEWYRHYFDFINNDDIKVVCYINSNWDSYPFYQSLDWGDTRVEKDPEIKEMWKDEMGNGYLQYSSDLFRKLSDAN